ncbi:MAG: nuclear transport factor 2 family protein [Oscillospiraceae bacterium]|nr:nuclear transport factor 2 family protein [Oscillospiraceae bacterium]MBQ5339626.1 nuclear transport factor 2 family protein [Oscillospiraceae bacterium]
MEEILRNYFQAWLRNDADTVRNTFAADAVYSECYGPEYHGLSQIMRWFADWNQKGTVLEWTIRRTFTQGRTLIAEWYFQCEYEGTVDGFDGVTVADFDNNGKITHLCEFQSKHEHIHPYDDTALN